MTILDSTLEIDGETLTVDALVNRYTAHMVGSIRHIVSGTERAPPDASLVRAARMLQTGSPAMIGNTAAWLDLLDALEQAGMGPKERFDVLVAVVRSDRPRGMIPGSAVLAHAAEPLSADDVRDAVAWLDADPRNSALPAAACCLPLLEAGEPPPPALDRAFLIRLPPPVLARVLAALEPAHREALLVENTRTDRDNMARVMLENLWFLDLDSPALREAMTRLREVAATYTGIEKLFAAMDAGPPKVGADGITEQIRPELEYWRGFVAEARKKAGLGAVAEHAATLRVPVPDAAELASVEAWAAATDERRTALAKAVLQAIGPKVFALVGLSDGPLPIAVYRHKRKKVLLSLVPGGEVEQGLSTVEEATIRTEAEAAGLDTYEELGQLLDGLDAMRPVHRVAVGPMLVGQCPGIELDPSKVPDWVERGPWRLPTESEWEYAARGGEPSHLTWRGDDLPLEDWYLEVLDLEEKTANRFGLWGFGLEPEVCADCWRPSYEGAPTDGSPATGKGPRVVRGGAAQLYPWQETGEWHLLLTAMRGSSRGWDYMLAARPVIGLQPT